MRNFRWGVLVLACWVQAGHAAVRPEAVAILYNSNVPESRRLAEFYREARGIPFENVVSLDVPAQQDISREQYDETIARPLRREFDRRGWWRRQRDGQNLLPVANRIRVLVTMRGIPLRINRQAQDPPVPADPQNPIAGQNEAAVDSELAMFGIEGPPINGVLQNRFFKSTRGIDTAEVPFMVLTARIDGPGDEVCRRMIRDAIETEKTGLWGRAYVDVANKIPMGDDWLETVVRANATAGIPTVVDRFNETLPVNYPMTEAALYYGWYDWHVSGPFLNPAFRFRKGAVAMHLHSFSAEQLGSGERNWSAPLLEKGAAVTIGNVFEPYLHLTHDFGLLHQRLLEGCTWVEAAWMAMPVTSWQGVVLGDPLYRPFRHLDGSGEKQEGDIEFRALRAAAVEWKDNPRERLSQLDKAVARMQSGTLAEALGLEYLEKHDPSAAEKWFRVARVTYKAPEDQMRQDFHLVALDRAAGRKPEAVRGLEDILARYPALPGSEGAKAWMQIVNPPPPPPPAEGGAAPETP